MGFSPSFVESRDNQRIFNSVPKVGRGGDWEEMGHAGRKAPNLRPRSVPGKLQGPPCGLPKGLGIRV